jgi:hypothetical protein
MAPYTVLQAVDGVPSGSGPDDTAYTVVGAYDARNAAHARHLAAERLPEEDVDRGVLLVAVTSKAWSTGHGKEKAETQRKIRSA